jgi:hypothetical protein
MHPLGLVRSRGGPGWRVDCKRRVYFCMRSDGREGLSPPCEGGSGGWAEHLRHPEVFRFKNAVPCVSTAGERAGTGVVSAQSITGSSEGRALRLAPAPRPDTDGPETQTRCQRRASPPPLPLLHKGGKQECTLAELAQRIRQECRMVQPQLFIIPQQPSGT